MIQRGRQQRYSATGNSDTARQATAIQRDRQQRYSATGNSDTAQLVGAIGATGAVIQRNSDAVQQ
ncbi:MAG: hypothetical protein L6420_04110 [Elusimicrobia bacterium]|nr:hypothetical protein [Elusimicrobiota bacterium]